jgi:hypothetical protein
MKLVHFTAPDGGAVGINPDQVSDIKPAEPGLYAAGARTVIVLGSSFHAVREAPAEVEKQLEGSS